MMIATERKWDPNNATAEERAKFEETLKRTRPSEGPVAPKSKKPAVAKPPTPEAELRKKAKKEAKARVGADVLPKLLETHWMVMVGGRVRIARWMPTVREAQDLGGEELCLFRKEDFRTFYENRVVQTSDPKGKAVQIPVAEVFFKNARRFHGVTMHPHEGLAVGPVGEERMNLWRGFGVEPRQGSWVRMREHIGLLTNGVSGEAEYVVKWCAWKVQNPVTPPEVALVFQGKKGSGKGTLCRALKRLFGISGRHISDSRHLTGKFNGHLMNCCLLFVDEAFYAADPRGESNLKRLITEPTLFVEPKGVDAFEVMNHLGVVMASNLDWVVPATEDERRFAVWGVPGDRIGDRAYFKALYEEMDGGGLAAMLYDLRGMDLKGWHPREDVPQTEGLKEQKVQSLRGVDAIVYQLAWDGVLPHSQGHDTVHTTEDEGGEGFWAWCRKQSRDLLHENPKSLSKKFRGWGFTSFRLSTWRGLRAPPLAALRGEIDRRLGKQDWNPQDVWGSCRSEAERLKLVGR